MKDEADRYLGRRGPVIDRRSREKANSKLRRWNNLRGLASGNLRRSLVGVDTKIVDVPAMAGDRQREISRTRADVENDVTLGERHMVDETVAPHALARGHRDAEIIKGRQEVISCRWRVRSEEHTSELQSLMRISYAVFCLKKKTERRPNHATNTKQTRAHSANSYRDE